VSRLLSLRFHTPDRDLEVSHLKSRNGSNVRAVECNEHWAGFGAAHPMGTGIVDGLQTIRGRREAIGDSR